MPIYFLDPDFPIFPHPEMADENGIVAIGGDLSTERLLTAYSFGIFPWYNEEDPIIWWSPDPRAVVAPGMVKKSKSINSYFKKYELRIDTSFEKVINNCKHIARGGVRESWITEEMQAAYMELHRLGYAHSFETWHNNKLIGGLYGVSLGKCFFGESMFSLENNASKFAFINLSKILKAKEFMMIDCQVPNDHLMSMGCKELSRKEYLHNMRINLSHKTHRGSWENWHGTQGG